MTARAMRSLLPKLVTPETSPVTCAWRSVAYAKRTEGEMSPLWSGWPRSTRYRPELPSMAFVAPTKKKRS
jgi:hypothetical protein